MAFFQRYLPATTLARFRLGALGFACYTVVGGLFGATDKFGVFWLLGELIAALLLVGLYVVTFIGSRTFLLEPVLLAVLVVITGAGHPDPERAIALCLGALAIMPMQVRFVRTVVRLALLLTAYLVCTAVSPAAQEAGLRWHSEDVLTSLPILAMLGALNATVYALLERQWHATAQESLLARTGQQLIHEVDITQARAVANRALAALCEDWGEGTALVVRSDPGAAEDRPATAVVELAVLDDLVGVTVPLDTEADLKSVPVDVSTRTELGRIIGIDAPWWAFRCGDSGLYVLVSGRIVPTWLRAALRALATQWSLAERNCSAHAELAQRADSDQLTGLHNRASFQRRLEAICDTGINGAVFLIDLDDFKQVNDVYGHAAGDGLLVEIAHRIFRAAGPSGVAARLGGDEFAMILTGSSDLVEAEKAAESLREDLLQPVVLAEAKVSVGASIGVMAVDFRHSAADLMRCADIAMYSAKARGKNRVEPFREASHGSVAQLRRTEEHLARATGLGEITVSYQPRIDLDTGRTVGFEALARWHDHAMGSIPPAVFIPLAIRTGEIKALGRHVLASSCAQLAAWRNELGITDLAMSVNVALVQLYDPSFVSSVREILIDTATPADRLIIEITQEEALEADRAAPPITELAAMGVRVALDNFGTGHATVATLCAFPVHQLKFDRGLVTGSSASDQAMLRVITATAEVLGVELVAVGVETQAQADALCEAGVHTAQGFLYARPMPADETSVWLAQSPTARSLLRRGNQL